MSFRHVATLRWKRRHLEKWTVFLLALHQERAPHFPLHSRSNVFNFLILHYAGCYIKGYIFYLSSCAILRHTIISWGGAISKSRELGSSDPKSNLRFRKSCKKTSVQSINHGSIFRSSFWKHVRYHGKSRQNLSFPWFSCIENREWKIIA